MTTSDAQTTTQESHHVTFYITTEIPLPAGEQLFISGSHAALGNWDPAGLPLTRIEDSAWTAAARLPANIPVEYKITRGSWQTEEVLEDGTLIGNRVIERGSDRMERHTVRHWRDQGRDPIPQITGDYEVHEGFHSRYLRFDRKIIVWLPPSYGSDSDRRYPVLYMQDGQQIFDPQTSTWKKDWQVDEWCTQLIGEYRLEEIIVVGIYSTEDRFLEYNPTMAGEEYAKFMTEEMKPFIDGNYRTEAGRETTAVAGSSMGATISFYLAWTRPDVFFGAACLSPAFKFQNDRYNLDLVERSETIPDLRVYLYCGRGDSTEEELLVGTEEMAETLKKHGMKSARELLLCIDEDGCHNETSWAKHTGEWLLFLFGR